MENETNNRNKRESTIKYISLFSGIGGFEVGLDRIGGFECLMASDIYEPAKKIYEEKHGMRPRGDITKIKEQDIPAHQMIVAGFPCQPFSMAGQRKGFEDMRGTLIYDVLRIAKYHKTQILFLENVSCGFVKLDEPQEDDKGRLCPYRFFDPDELEQIQGFPKGFTRGIGRHERDYVVGNSVTPPLISEYGKYIKKAFNNM